jgi:hypothetical protein
MLGVGPPQPSDSPGPPSTPSSNPLAAVLRLLGQSLEMIPYGPDRTCLVFPQGTFNAQVRRKGGREEANNALRGACPS